MIALDVNVLVAAVHSAAPDHEQTREWLEQMVSMPEPVGVSDAVLAGTLRVLTHPRVFDPPVPIDRALEVLDQMVDHPGVVMLTPLPGFWARLRDLCADTQAKGNLVADAANAVLAMQHGAVFVTKDRDFARFPGLRWRPPGGDF
ncbi:type II toxin-antitoxin system VapC family toxin [soil metagenome]